MREASIQIGRLVIHMRPGREQAPNPILLLGMERGNLVSPPSGTACRKALPMVVRAWEVGGSERRAVMVWIRV